MAKTRADNDKTWAYNEKNVGVQREKRGRTTTKTWADNDRNMADNDKNVGG